MLPCQAWRVSTGVEVLVLHVATPGSIPASLGVMSTEPGTLGITSCDPILPSAHPKKELLEATVSQGEIWNPTDHNLDQKKQQNKSGFVNAGVKQPLSRYEQDIAHAYGPLQPICFWEQLYNWN